MPRAAHERRAGGGLKHMQVEPLDLHRFESVVSSSDYTNLLELIDAAARELRGRVIWNVNSAYKGGGVAELLPGLVGYARGSGIDARWAVIRGEAEFFELTKRLHNHLHGFDYELPLDETARRLYERTLRANAADLVPLLHPDDVVILHDPQTAGLVSAASATGATVIWRCHVGMDRATRPAREAWAFLRPYVKPADAYVFSRATFAWTQLERKRITVIHPSIDAFSTKNQPQSQAQSRSILARAGMLSGQRGNHATFTRSDGTPGRIDRQVDLLGTAPLAPNDQVVVQVSRWDRLKDHLGVMRAFAERVVGETGGHLLLAGPAVEGVGDDPEGAGVLATIVQAWRELPGATQKRIHLASLPMSDVEENAAIVNALQRHATLVVQKSLAEGFGLTVAEAMWKARPAVASRIGGIQDQIVDGESGVLIADPWDLDEFAGAVVGLLVDPVRREQIGAAAHARIRDHFLAPQHLGQYFELIGRLLAERQEEHQAEPQLEKASGELERIA